VRFFHCRCCGTLKEENTRLWALITSMRSVTIEPKREQPMPVIVKAADRRVEVTEDKTEPSTAFRRSTERVVFYDEPDEPAEGKD
jgi:hypothetical protein